ncbi:acyl-CoA N-acyltransferase [Pilobolus umbonatus]|nr:acyl-CoA N-acyltransferase [Pilobolus umbonatus]
MDEFDEVSQHWVAYGDTVDGKTVPIGTIRLVPKPGPLAKLTRLAVLSDARGLYVGQLLVKTLVDYAKEKKFKTVMLHSQYDKRFFYFKQGFVIEKGDGDIFIDTGTPHVRVWMRNI